MANSFKNYFVKSANSTGATVLTVGAGVQTTVIGMTIANMVSTPVTANIFVTSSGTDYYMLKEASIPVGGALVPIGGDQKLVLEATDSLKVTTSANTDVIVSALEIS